MQVSDLFSNICKYCKDPEVCHERAGLDYFNRPCLVGICRCRNYERDNLKYLEQLSKE
jgi:hypothetical protein